MNCVAVHIVDSYSPRIDCVDPCLQKDATYKENEKELTTLTLLCAESYGTILRTVPTIVTAHTFCASRDTRVSYEWCLLIQEYFCAF